GANKLTGNDGANKLDGKGGDDSMDGGKGNDTYFVDSISDQVSEMFSAAAGGGVGTGFSSRGFKLGANIKNFMLAAGALGGIGNGLNKRNLAAAGGDPDLLDGGAGNDTMIGGGGDDEYHVDSSKDVVTETAQGGHDDVVSTVSFVLGANIEVLDLVGNGALDGTGNAINNEI